MYRTQNDLPESTRSKVVELLGARLADAIELRLEAKQAHWNVKGPSFFALHQLFDQADAELGGYVDEVAERLVQLGGVACGTSRAVAERTQLAAYPLTALPWRQHVETFSRALATFGKSVRAGIDQADALHDQDTADIFTEISRGTDKLLWMVEAHLQD